MSNRVQFPRQGVADRQISDNDYRLMIEAVKDYAIFMLNPGGFIQNWNAGAQLMKGYTAEEIIGQHFSIFYPTELLERNWTDYELTAALEHGSYEEEGWRVRKDGSRFWANVIITALFDSQGRHRGFAKVTRDLTEKRRTEVLENESRRITAFITMLAHELRNPLAPIDSAVTILGKESTLSNKGIAARDILARQSKQMTRLVDDLLDMSRIAEGKIHLESKAVQLSAVLQDALTNIEPFMLLQSHTVTVDAGSDPVWVEGDATRLIQVVGNLLHNAAKFTPQCGSIKVAVFAEDDTAVISVVDNGMGIDPARLTHLFERFEQRDNDANKTFGGLGLGLSLSQELIHLHHGSLAAFSTGVPGEGSTFTLRVPRMPAPQAERDTQVTSNTILVVDDNRDTANVVAMLLETLGFHCETAYSGQQAISKIVDERPAVVLLDVGLPDIDGHAVARHVLANVANPPPMIAVTGYGQDKDREQSLKAGFYAHIIKPVDTDKLEVLLHVLLAKR